MSLVLFYFFFLLYALSFFLISLRISVVIHGQPYLVRAVLYGTFLLRLYSVVCRKVPKYHQRWRFLYTEMLFEHVHFEGLFQHFPILPFCRVGSLDKSRILAGILLISVYAMS
mgnify:CR=1 FL=1